MASHKVGLIVALAGLYVIDYERQNHMNGKVK